jgi:hypothetical protein
MSAGGTRDQAVSSLKSATVSGDTVGGQLRDFLVAALEEADGNPDLRYDVSASGHGGPKAVLTMSASVTTRWLRPDEREARSA